MPGTERGEGIWGLEVTTKDMQYLLSDSDTESTKDELIEDQEHAHFCSD